MLSRILLRVFCAAILLQTIPTLSAYSVLSHEAVIDSCWNDSIVPVLSKRFPNPTQEQLREARAFAYGGSIIQDLGYYPFGSRFFSNLVHYVRSGDFVETMITEARDRNELAFAIGALAHYVSDSNGHSLATNRTVPLLYPELKRKYGNVVTFAEKPSAHIKVEFGFDVLQVARGKYVPEAYHEFIGFEVSKDLLERSFQKTYGLEIKDVFTSTDLAIGTYRHTVSTIIPDLTQTAWNLKREEIQKLVPDANMSSFQFRLASGEYVQKWGKEYKKPGLVARITGFFFRIIPKFGPFKVLAFKPPTPEVEQLFLSSFDVTLVRFRSSLQQLKQNHLQLKNMDLDTGDVTQPGEYQLADQTYQKLLLKLQKGSEHPSAELVQNIRSYYKDVDQRAYSKKERQKILAALDQLAGIATSADSNAVRRSN